MKDLEISVGIRGIGQRKYMLPAYRMYLVLPVLLGLLGYISYRGVVLLESDKEMFAKAPAPVETKAAPQPEKVVTKQVASRVAVGGFKIEELDSELVVDLMMLNTRADQAASGHFWAVADYESEAGDVIKVVYPDTMSLDDVGMPKSVTRAFPYRMKLFKSRKFSFDKPTIRGRFVHLSVNWQDSLTGYSKSEVSLNL